MTGTEVPYLVSEELEFASGSVWPQCPHSAPHVLSHHASESAWCVYWEWIEGMKGMVPRQKPRKCA